MNSKIRRAVTRRGFILLPAAVLLMLFVLPVAITHAWPDPGHQLDPIEQEVVDLVNQERASRHLQPYIVNFSLQEAAWRHTEHMAAHRVLCHSGCGDGDPASRIKATGYQAADYGENVASGQHTAAEVMTSWMNSSGHRANILNKNYTDIGVAFASGGLYGTTWTQVFGLPASGYATITPPAGGVVPTPGACHLPADVNGDRRVTNDDVREVAGHAGARAGSPRFEDRLDVVPDAVINVYDTFKVMLAVGQSCPG